MTVSASVYSFFAWQNAMKAILQQTETDSNLVATLGNLGMTLAFPAGMCYELFGNQMAAVIAGILFGVAYSLLWLGTGQWQAKFRGQTWIVDVLYFMVGFGGSFSYMAAMMPNVENFPYEQRGKVIGLLDASLSLGPTLLSVLYNSAFVNGHIDPDEQGLQNLSGYFLVVGIISVAANLGIFFLVGRVPPHSRSGHSSIQDVVPTETSPVLDHDTLSQQQADTNDSQSEQTQEDEEEEEDIDGAPNDYSEFPFAELPITKVVFRWSFWFLLIQYVLNACLQLTYQNNIPTYLKSFHLDHYNLLFTVLNTTLQTVSKFAAGIISDVIAQSGKAPRAVVFLIPYALQTIFLLISCFWGDNFGVLTLTCIFVGVANGVTWCQTPTLIGELFGVRYMGSNWGWTMLLTAGLGFPFAIGFSQIYEAAIIDPSPTEHDCFGLGCFTWSFAMLGGASLATLIASVALTQNMYENAKWRRSDREERRRQHRL